MIRIGLPKGNLIEKSKKLMSLVLGNNEKYDSLYRGNEMYSFYLLKHRDIPKMLNESYIDIGITSTEWVNELSLTAEKLMSLNWCNTRMSLIASENEAQKQSNVRISCVTEYPNIAKKYFEQNKITCDIYYVSGSSEALVPTIFDYSIDCVETGSTLKKNNLYEKKVLFTSDIAVYSNVPNAMSCNSVKYFLDCLIRI